MLAWASDQYLSAVATNERARCVLDRLAFLIMVATQFVPVYVEMLRPTAVGRFARWVRCTIARSRQQARD
jgi:hypothetical protein